MGEVYRATDTSLAWQVAVKVLPEAVAADAERLARFDREAKTLAALNHPNIAAYGLEKSAGTTALVMELVEGPTLADRIGKGPIPIDEALPIAKQIPAGSAFWSLQQDRGFAARWPPLPLYRIAHAPTSSCAVTVTMTRWHEGTMDGLLLDGHAHV